MSLGGLIAGALRGGAEAVGEQSRGWIEDARKLDVARELAALEEQKALRIAEAQERLRREGVIHDTAGAGGQAKLAYDKQRTQEVGAAETAVQVAREQQMGPVRAENAGREATARGEAENKTLTARLSDPEYIKGKRREAQATHIESAASAASAEATRFNLQQARTMAGLYDQYDAAQTPEEREVLRERIAVRGGKDPDKFQFLPIKDELGQVTGYEARSRVTGQRVDGPAAGGGGGQSAAHDEARAAIARGADPKAVNARLQAKGFAPLR